MDSIDYYNKYASLVFEDTVNQNMEHLIEEFSALLKEGDAILDMGCGSGRDSLVFYERGYDVTPMDGSIEMCRLAEIHTGLDALHMNYEEMNFEQAFDGVWACASLVHLPKAAMPKMLNKIARALTPEGILYLSLKKGSAEGFQGEIYMSFYEQQELAGLIADSGLFALEKVWITADVRAGHSQEQWINILARKRVY